MPEPWLGLLIPEPRELRGARDTPGDTCLGTGVVRKGWMGLWSMGTCLSQDAAPSQASLYSDRREPGVPGWDLITLCSG